MDCRFHGKFPNSSFLVDSRFHGKPPRSWFLVDSRFRGNDGNRRLQRAYSLSFPFANAGTGLLTVAGFRRNPRKPRSKGKFRVNGDPGVLNAEPRVTDIGNGAPWSQASGPQRDGTWPVAGGNADKDTGGARRSHQGGLRLAARSKASGSSSTPSPGPSGA